MARNERIIPIVVKDEFVCGDGVQVGAAGSHRDVLLEITFSEMWLGLTKKIQWRNALGEDATVTLLTADLLEEGYDNVYLVPIPYEAKSKAGKMTVSITGEEIAEGKEVSATKTAVATFKVLDSGNFCGGPDIDPGQADQLQAAIEALDAGIPGRIDERVEAHNTAEDAHTDIREEIALKLDSATIKSEGIPEITSPETLRTYFYERRKETSRSWQFEVSTGSNENIINALGGFPDDHTAAEKWFLYIQLPYTEAGGFVIHAQLEGRGNGLLYRQDQFATLDQRWHTTGWIQIQDVQKHLSDHEARTDNPHKVTYDQVGADKAGAAGAVQQNLTEHKNNRNNPHGVTASQIGAPTTKEMADADKAVLAAAKKYTDDSVAIPQANETTLGGVKAKAKTDDDVQEVHIDPVTGMLWTKQGGGSTGAVTTVFGRKGDVVAQKGDYTADMVGARADTWVPTLTDVGAEASDTAKVADTIATITDEATFRTYFYELRKSPVRKYQFEISDGGAHENIVTGVGGRPRGASAADSAFIYVEIPFSEAGGYVIHVTYEMRSKSGIWEKKIYGTLDSRWQDTGWYQPTFVTKTVITPHGSGSKADMTASEIINAARRGVVQAEYTDSVTNELRTYQYFKQMPDGRAVFAVNGYIEGGVPKQTLIYVDYAGNVTTETRSAKSGLTPEIRATVETGAEVTCTDGATTLTETSEDGQCVFSVPNYGSWSVSAAKGGAPSNKVVVAVDAVKQYTVELEFFSATLTVTAEDGATVAATSSGATYSGVCGPDGTVALTIRVKGNYSVKARKNGVDSDIVSVDIQNQGQAYTAKVAFIVLTVTAPDGSAITVKKADVTLTGTGGTAAFYLPTTGTWTVTATKGGDTATETVKTDSHRAYSVKLDYIHIYGVRWDGSAPTTWERTDESAGFVNPAPAVSNGSGSSPFDGLYPWSSMEVEERTAGTMVKVGHYGLQVKSWGNGGLWVRIATKVNSEFPCDPGCSDRGDGKGQRDHIYIGRYHCGGDWKSRTGQNPKTNITHPASWNGIHSLGSNIWMWDWAAKWSVNYLYLVEFADWNSQKVIGKGCGNNSGTQAMGYTDGMKYHTGTTQSSRDTYGLGTQYRNIEGLWDNAYDWIGGCYYNSGGLNVVMNPASFSPGNQSGGKLIGPMVSGWSSKFKIGSLPWAIVPTETSGSEATYMSDHWNFSASSPCLCVGGNYNQGGYYGVFHVSQSSASDAGGYISARSMELP